MEACALHWWWNMEPSPAARLYNGAPLMEATCSVCGVKALLHPEGAAVRAWRLQREDLGDR